MTDQTRTNAVDDSSDEFAPFEELTEPGMPGTSVDASPLAPTEPALRARTRWAGIVWGLVLAAIAGAGIWLTGGEGRVGDLVEWTRGLSLATAIGIGVLVVGVLLLVTGLVGLLRRAQRAVAARSRS